MKTGTCPKCASREVFTNSRFGFFSRSFRGYTLVAPFLGSVLVDEYVCAACGFAESYVPGEKALARLAKHWRRVAPPG
jgi:hypothetical protein